MSEQVSKEYESGGWEFAGAATGMLGASVLAIWELDSIFHQNQASNASQTARNLKAQISSYKQAEQIIDRPQVSAEVQNGANKVLERAIGRHKAKVHAIEEHAPKFGLTQSFEAGGVFLSEFALLTAGGVAVVHKARKALHNRRHRTDTSPQLAD